MKKFINLIVFNFVGDVFFSPKIILSVKLFLVHILPKNEHPYLHPLQGPYKWV